VTLREKTLLAIAEVHSGNGAEGERIADAALSVLRQWLADQGLVVVPSTPTREMLLKAGATPDGISPRGGTDYLGKMLPKYYTAMIAAAPDVLGKP
jgi:hypothetical protein